MPNYCDYEMKINGKKENVEKLISYLQAEYSYKGDGTVECSADKHFFRVFGADVLEEYEIDPGKEDTLYTAIVGGCCAWSVYSCMMQGEHTYYNRVKESNKKEFYGTHMIEATRELDLEVEIFSEEPGCGFMEHYRIDKGEVLVDDCVDWCELYDEEGEPIYDEETGEQETEGGVEWAYTI